jgi:hypothetical protein
MIGYLHKLQQVGVVSTPCPCSSNILILFLQLFAGGIDLLSMNRAQLLSYPFNQFIYLSHEH